MKLRTLAMKELTESQTGLYLKRQILETIEQYGISISQIYSVTTDNGANMLNAVKRLMEHQRLTLENAPDNVTTTQSLIDEDEEDVDEEESTETETRRD